MLNLYCAIVGVAGASFSVKTDEGEWVGGLKNAIKERKPDTIQCEANLLQLFLVKKDKGRGEWLAQADVQKGVRDTSDYKCLRYPGERLRAFGLASSQLGEVSDEAGAAGLGPVHVLVRLPKISKTGYDEHSDSISSYRKIADLEGRFRLLLALLNVAQLLPSLVKMCPGSARNEYKTLDRDLGIKVYLEPSRVIKYLPEPIFTGALAHIETVYPVDLHSVVCTELL